MKKTKMTEKGEVVLTDSPEEARTLQKSIPVIGICSPGSDKDWSGISFLADDWEDVDDEYATNTSVIRKSTDLIHWTDGGKMFEKKPSFVTESGAAVWAPDIEKIGDKYILYYAMSAMGKPASAGIGIASADSPEGPFSLDISVDGKGKLFTSKIGRAHV